LAAAVILTLNKNNPINNAKKAAFVSDAKVILEETNLYMTSQMLSQNILYPCKENAGDFINPVYEDITTEAKKLIAKFQSKYMYNGLYDIYNINLKDVYILDSEKIKSSKEFKDNILFLKKPNGGFSLIFNKPVSLLGIDIYELENIEAAYDDRETKIFAVGNNTFKLDKTGHVKALGEKNEISGATDLELKELKSPWKEFKPNELVPNTVKYKLAHGTAYMLNDKGELYAIGDNLNNKLGLGNEYLQLEPVKLTFPEDIKVKEFFAGARHTFVIDTNNNVWAAGSNEQGEFGLKNTNKYNGFVKISAIDGARVKDIILSVNNYIRYTIVVYDSGDVIASGSNGLGSLGDVNYSPTNEFKNISDAWKKNTDIKFPLKRIEMNSLVSGILDANDTLWVCGYNHIGQLGNGDKKDQYSFVRFMDNVEQFNMSGGVLCQTKSKEMYITPKEVYNEADKILEYISEKVLVNNLPAGDKKFARGYNIYDIEKNEIVLKKLAFVSNSKVYYAQSDEKEIPSFSIVEDVDAPKDIIDISSGFGMLMLKDKNEKIYLFNQNVITAKGKNIQSELRDVNKNQTFEYVDGFRKKIHLIDGEYRLWLSIKDKNTYKNVVKSIVTASNEYMLLNNGELYSRGESVTVNYGAGGWGTNDKKEDFVLIQNNVGNIYACDGGAISIDKNGNIYCFGQLWGQFLNIPGYKGDAPIVEVPTLVKGKINNIGIKDIYLLQSNGGIGGTSTYLKDGKGDIYTYGGSLYNGIGHYVSDFTKIALPGKVKKIKCGYNYTLCLLENGEVYAWGTNTNGQFGNGYTVLENYPTPQKLNIDSVVEIAAGNGYAIYVKDNGQMYGCGKNEFGQLGDSTTKSATEFVRCINLEK
ncbi:MAG: hypothetical protein RSE57_00170, partial [Clostridia bacterium]